MILPDSFKDSLLKEKNVFYFSSDKINSKEHHNFILLKNIDNKIIILSCCTSQYATIQKYIKASGNHQDTIASIDYNAYSFLSKPTFINCNGYIEYTRAEFFKLYEDGKITYRSEISNEEYSSIVNGCLLSDDIEEEFKDLLR